MSSPEESIKRAWITSGNGDLWQTAGTYSTVAYQRLPFLPSLAPPFRWLSELPPRAYGCTLDSNDNRLADFSYVEAALNALGFSLPNEFRTFITRPDLQARIPSCTACYLELSEAVTPLPGYPDSYVVRFLNDSQACVLWYLLSQPSISVRVLATSCFIERDIFDAMEYEKAVDEPLHYEAVLEDACICAESFGEFLCRFCLENTIWFASQDHLPLAPCELTYLQAATQKI